MCVIPESVGPLWDEVVRIMELHGVEHPNKAVKNGMILEMLVADFLAGPRHYGD